MSELNRIKKFYRGVIFGDDFWASHYMVTGFIRMLAPISIFEFGSAWGKNWTLMRDVMSPATKYQGLDINVNHMIIANQKGIKVMLGDEERLKEFDDNSFELTFTSSILNHLPPDTFKFVLDHLKRIAKKYVILCECNQLEEFRWYKHDYVKEGFTDTGLSAYSPIIKATYRLYTLRS